MGGGGGGGGLSILGYLFISLVIGGLDHPPCVGWGGQGRVGRGGEGVPTLPLRWGGWVGGGEGLWGGDEHVPTIQFDCIHCDYRATERKHIKSFHGGVEFDCDCCDHRFMERGSLRKHIKSVHRGMKFDCVHCDYRPMERGNLRNYAKSVYAGVKFYCIQCDYRAT